jgi:hypothetical protein
VNEFRRLQAQERELNQSVWADELLAQEYEQVFIDMWDRMRATTDKFPELASATFDQLVFGQSGTLTEHELGIQETRFDGDDKTLSHAEWIDFLNSLQADGLIMEQSEWRLTRFEKETEQGAKSVIAMSVHAKNAAADQRYMLTGNLEVSWKNKTAIFPHRPLRAFEPTISF